MYFWRINKPQIFILNCRFKIIEYHACEPIKKKHLHLTTIKKYLKTQHLCVLYWI